MNLPYFVKYFYKQGVKPLLISLKQAGVGCLIEVPNQSETNKESVAKALDKSLADRDLCVAFYRYDSEYNKLSFNIRLVGGKSETLVVEQGE